MSGAKRQERAAATRQHLVEAARSVFAERGYQGASVASITDAADTAHGTFYLYFRNKEDAFVQVMSEAIDQLYEHSFTPVDETAADIDAARTRDRIAAFLTAFVAEGRLWRALFEAVLVNPVIEEQWLTMRSRFHEGVAERLVRAQAAGQLRDLDAELVAAALCGMLEWLALTGVAFESPRPLVADDATIDSVSDLWVRALDLGAPGTARGA